MRNMDQSVFDGQPPEVTVACVDYDGLLKFGKNARNLRYTWASERFRGADWVSRVPDSGYKPLTSIFRAPWPTTSAVGRGMTKASASPPAAAEKSGCTIHPRRGRNPLPAALAPGTLAKD